MYNLFKGFCMLMGLCCTIYICWTCIFFCRFGMSCAVQFIYVKLIYFLGFLEWEETCVVVWGGLMKCALRQKWKIVTQERSTIYGMVNNIMFKIDTLENDVIKRKIMPWRSQKCRKRWWSGTTQWLTIATWSKLLKWPQNILAIKIVFIRFTNGKLHKKTWRKK